MRDLYNKLEDCLEDPTKFLDHMLVMETKDFGALYESCITVLGLQGQHEKVHVLENNFKVKMMLEHFEAELGEHWKYIENAVDVLSDHISNGTKPPATYKETDWTELDRDEIIRALGILEPQGIADSHLAREFLHGFIPKDDHDHQVMEQHLYSNKDNEEEDPLQLGEMEKEGKLRHQRTIIAEGIKADPENYETFDLVDYIISIKVKMAKEQNQ